MIHGLTLGSVGVCDRYRDTDAVSDGVWVTEKRLCMSEVVEARRDAEPPPK